MKFEELNLNSDLKASIQKLGFTDCTDIQEAAFDPIVSGKDVAGLSQTGSGKTAAFLIPLIERIYRSREENSTRGFKDWKSNSFILVLVPTRELAEQVLKNLDHLTTDEKIRAVSVYGGVSYDKQKSLIAEGVEFVIATPGRLIDLHKEHVINLSNVKAIVFDEADRMFDMGFKDDMRYILQRIPLERQYLVFSATLNFDVLNVAYEFGSNPLELNISRENTKAEQVNDHILHVGQEDKPKFLLSILKKTNPEQVIVFSNFKKNVERLAPFLTANGFGAEAISSLLTQAQRSRIMAQFKENGKIKILVATDVAARGLDIKNVDLVINYELPDDAANYVHRIGRTGRAGRKGEAYSLVSDRDVEALARIEEFLDYKIQIGWLEDDDLVEEFEALKDRSPSRKISDTYSKRKNQKTNNNHSKRKKRPTDRPDRPERSEEATSTNAKGPRRPKKSTTHRDRLKGRHGKKKSQESVSSEIPKNKNSNSRKSKKGVRTRSSQQKMQSQTTQPGMGSKIKGFFKKIFK